MLLYIHNYMYTIILDLTFILTVLMLAYTVRPNNVFTFCLMWKPFLFRQTSIERFSQKKNNNKMVFCMYVIAIAVRRVKCL